MSRRCLGQELDPAVADTDSLSGQQRMLADRVPVDVRPVGAGQVKQRHATFGREDDQRVLATYTLARNLHIAEATPANQDVSLPDRQLVDRPIVDGYEQASVR